MTLSPSPPPPASPTHATTNSARQGGPPLHALWRAALPPCRLPRSTWLCSVPGRGVCPAGRLCAASHLMQTASPITFDLTRGVMAARPLRRQVYQDADGQEHTGREAFRRYKSGTASGGGGKGGGRGAKGKGKHTRGGSRFKAKGKRGRG